MTLYIYLVLTLSDISISTSPINTSGKPIHNKTLLLLSPYNINPIPKHCNAIPTIVKYKPTRKIDFSELCFLQ